MSMSLFVKGFLLAMGGVLGFVVGPDVFVSDLAAMREAGTW